MMVFPKSTNKKNTVLKLNSPMRLLQRLVPACMTPGYQLLDQTLQINIQ